MRFRRAELLAAVKRHSGVRVGRVKYLRLRDMRSAAPRIRDLPFLKRWAFQHESEFRLIYESETKKLPCLDLPISLACFERITLSPWLHESLSSHLKRTLKSIPGCRDLEIVRSTLISNEEWQRHGESAE